MEGTCAGGIQDIDLCLHLFVSVGYLKSSWLLYLKLALNG